MYKISLIFSLLLMGSSLFAREVKEFVLRNTTASKLEVKLRLGSVTKKFTVDPLGKLKITEDKKVCLNKVEVLAVNKKLVGKKAKIEDIKGCSGKTIIFTDKDDELKIEGVEENLSAELGKQSYSKQDSSSADKSSSSDKNLSDSKSKDKKDTSSQNSEDESTDIDDMIKTYK